MDQHKYKVCVKCSTFNQSSYICRTLDGFCFQNTSFPYVCVIIDDASTDGEQDVIRNYLQTNFDLEDKTIAMNEETDNYVLTYARHRTNVNCFAAVFYLKYNHYSIKKPRHPYYSMWQNKSKYAAACEGDDYWVDSLKLQKQYDFMESHPTCSMCFHPNYRLFPDNKMTKHYPKPIKEMYGPKDVILAGGGMLATSSIFYLCRFYPEAEDRPDFWKNAPVGDVPLRLYMAAKGNIGYINDIMSVYRKSSGSWFLRNQKISKRIATTRAQQLVLDGYDAYTNHKYHNSIVKGKILNWLRCIKLISRILMNRIVN